MGRNPGGLETEDITVCRCEGVSWGQVQEAMVAFRPTSLRQLKLVTRWGMGMCQGRVCRPLMAATGLSDAESPERGVRVRIPIKPLGMAAFGGGDQDDPGAC